MGALFAQHKTFFNVMTQHLIYYKGEVCDYASNHALVTLPLEGIHTTNTTTMFMPLLIYSIRDGDSSFM